MDDDLLQEIRNHHVLHWNYRGFEVLPDELRTNGRHVGELYLKMNNISVLPQWLGELQNLTNLYLCDNKLKRLPEEVCEMKSLEVLDVRNNNLIELPITIGLLPKLKTLLIMNNKITAFPREIHMLPAIKVIDGTGNLIISIEEICRCLTLEELYLDNNLLLCLPRKIVYMPKLKTLSVCRNNLLYLPSLPFISDLDISFNFNPSLNCIPYPLGCQMNENSTYNLEGEWDLRISGCSEITGETDNLPNLKILLPSGDKLVMPLGLKSIQSPSDVPKPPTLHELAIQIVYQIIYQQKLYFCRKKEKHVFHMTRTFIHEPSYIMSLLTTNNESKNMLLKGPVSICLGVRCSNPIFSHCIAWVIPKRIAYRLRVDKDTIYSTIFFCTHRCSNSFKHNLLSHNPEQWEIELVNTKQSWKVIH
ncbi:leucine-rich repeat-containing protein 28 [Ischnura elegans]|uniref:leucine-rich repeat-containing protein 28 n=1 Tax=Ischnura elegans TaxID=197161 RepID=UPI001ED882E8|nr:leucine-rich repeat-containing protein 28 [Ischnura elegans]